MIRAIELPDISRAAEIQVFGWRTAYRGIVSDEILFNRIQVLDKLDRYRDAAAGKSEEIYVFDDGIIKAFMSIAPCRDADKPDSFELCAVYVEPFFKGQGIGAEMVKFCERKAFERGFREVCLWVLEENAASRKFYEKCGYSPDGKRQLIEGLGVMEVRYVKNLSVAEGL